MIIDKKGKLFGKISIIDLAVILLVIVMAIGIYLRLGGSAADLVKETKSFTYTVKVENVREYTVDMLNKKGKITDKKNEKVIGEIVDVEKQDSNFQSVTNDGRVVYTPIPERYNCIVTIRAEGKESADSYFTADNTELSVGKTFEIYSKYVKTSGSVTDITVA